MDDCQSLPGLHCLPTPRLQLDFCWFCLQRSVVLLMGSPTLFPVKKETSKPWRERIPHCSSRCDRSFDCITMYWALPESELSARVVHNPTSPRTVQQVPPSMEENGIPGMISVPPKDVPWFISMPFGVARQFLALDPCNTEGGNRK